jgi:hypothetical protein
VFGDAAGRVSIISPSTGVLLEIPSSTQREVTALTSFTSERHSIVVVAGYSDGSLQWHTLFDKEDQETTSPPLSGSILSESSSPWVVLDAFALHGGKHGISNIAGATLDGQIAWGRIYVGGKKKIKNRINEMNELTWDSLFTRFSNNRNITSDTNTNNYTTISTSTTDGIIGVKAHLKAAEFITHRGELIWSPFAATKRKQEKQAHVLKPPRPCTGWDKITPNIQHQQESTIAENIIFSAVAIEAPSAPTSRIFSFINGGELASIRTGTASARPICHVIARVPLEKSKSSTESNTVINSMAALPGYVVAVTAAGELQIYNTSGAFHRPSFDTVVRQPLHELRAEIHDKINSNSNANKKLSSGGRGAGTLWRWHSMFGKATNEITQISSPNNNYKEYYRIAAGFSTSFPTTTPQTSSGLVAIQFSPTLIGFYATSLPYTPPRGTPGNPGSSTRVNWLAAVQPLLIAAVVGFSLHKARVGKRQAAAQQFFRARRMERSGGGGGEIGGEEDWDAPFPWEQRVKSRSKSTLRGGGTSSGASTAASGGQTSSRDHPYRRKFRIDTGLGGRRAHTTTNTNRPNMQPPLQPPPLVDRAPFPVLNSNYTLDDQQEEEEEMSQSSEYSDGEAIIE